MRSSPLRAASASASGRALVFALAGSLALPLVFAKTAHADPSSTSPEKGFDLGEIQGVRSLGMGGALNALGSSTTALFLNPANMTQARVYHIEGMATFSPEARRQSYGGAIVDSVLNKNHLAGGVTANWSLMDPDGIHRSWTDIRAALAYPLGDRLSVGATGRYLRVNQSVAAGPLGASFASGGTDGQPLLNQLTFDLGATLAISQMFHAGLVGHNLTNPGTGLAPTTLAGGLGATTKVFSIEGDALVDFTTWGKARWRAMLGGEVFLAGSFALRIGYRFDEGTKSHALSGGLGYVDKKWALEIGARHDIVGEHPATMATASFKYFYNAATVQQDEPDGF